jgi:hypothetical protein
MNSAPLSWALRGSTRGYVMEDDRSPLVDDVEPRVDDTDVRACVEERRRLPEEIGIDPIIVRHEDHIVGLHLSESLVLVEDGIDVR